MKKTITVLFLVFLLAMTSVLAEEDTDTERFEVLKAHITYQAAKIEVGMATSISYIQELGGDTTDVEALQAEFEALAAQVGDFSSLAGLRAGNAEMKEIVRAFRETTTSLVEENAGDIETLRTRIQEAIAADADVEAAREAFKISSQGYLLARFDRHYDRFEGIYERVLARYGESNPEEVAALKANLDSLASYRSVLESAATTGDKEMLREAYSSIHGLHQTFIQGVQDLAATDRGEGANPIGSGQSTRAEKLLGEMETSIRELSSLGYDVSSLESISALAKTDFDAAQSSGDYNAFKADAQAFVDAVRELIGADDARVRALERSRESLDDDEESEDTEEEDSNEEEREQGRMN